MKREHWHDDDHDDFGGLRRDLRSAGAAMGRRQMLRLGALGALGAGFGALTLLGCSSDSIASATSSDGRRTQ